MKILECFKTPIWALEKPDFIRSLTKATDPYIKESKQRFKEKYKKTDGFGVSYHSTQLLGDSKFKDFHTFVGVTTQLSMNKVGFKSLLEKVVVIIVVIFTGTHMLTLFIF